VFDFFFFLVVDIYMVCVGFKFCYIQVKCVGTYIRGLVSLIVSCVMYRIGSSKKE
jgi:hypothetical protein